MKTLNVYDKDLEISSLVESFVDTDERPIQIITEYDKKENRTTLTGIEIFAEKNK